jgi:hypothetical protein
LSPLPFRPGWSCVAGAPRCAPASPICSLARFICACALPLLLLTVSPLVCQHCVKLRIRRRLYDSTPAKQFPFGVSDRGRKAADGNVPSIRRQRVLIERTCQIARFVCAPGPLGRAGIILRSSPSAPSLCYRRSMRQDTCPSRGDGTESRPSSAVFFLSRRTHLRGPGACAGCVGRVGSIGPLHADPREEIWGDEQNTLHAPRPVRLVSKQAQLMHARNDEVAELGHASGSEITSCWGSIAVRVCHRGTGLSHKGRAKGGGKRATRNPSRMYTQAKCPTRAGRPRSRAGGRGRATRAGARRRAARAAGSPPCSAGARRPAR